MPEEIHLSSGRAPQQRQTPQVIAASGKARDSIARTVIGGSILGVLSVAYVVALFTKHPDTGGVLGVIGTGLGFLLGKSRSAK